MLAFRSDNPGAWVLNYHAGWHLEQGFAVQIVELEKEVRGLLGGQWGVYGVDTGVGGELCCLGWICGEVTGVEGRDSGVRWELGAWKIGNSPSAV